MTTHSARSMTVPSRLDTSHSVIWWLGACSREGQRSGRATRAAT